MERWRGGEVWNVVTQDVVVMDYDGSAGGSVGGNGGTRG